MENPYQFVGTSIPYRRLSGSLNWGDFYVDNKRRSRRKQPLHPGDCPFCAMVAGGSVPAASVRHAQFGSEDYLIVDNNNPIVKGQRMLIPAPADLAHPVHRLDLNANDVRLALTLARGVLPEVADARWACYVNTLPGTGRSVAHLHINCVPAKNVPLLPQSVAPWQICTTESGSTISRLAGVGFYALAVENDDDTQLAATVADLHGHMNEWQQPYNFLVYSDDAASTRVALIPRDSEYCEAADQRVAGLEFLTGVLIPGAARLDIMDTILRDRALWQATLKGDAQLELERLLRSVYGLPAAGSVVRARPESINRYKGVVEPNDILSPGYVRPLPKSIDRIPVFGEIDRRFWFPLPPDHAPLAFHDKRVNANVLVRITRASICQSDRRVLANEKSAEVLELALGHEGGGYVVDPGPWDDELAAGEKVVVLPHLSCGECEPCHRYMSNLCKRMEHLGFHLHGNLATLMAFPYQCVLPTGADFPDDALPLIEPLACVLRALFRIRIGLRRLAEENGTLTIFGGGPMGYLTALAVQRNWNSVQVRIVEPNACRRKVIEGMADGFQVLERMPSGRKSAMTFVAASNFTATVDALRATDFGGTALLFAGINTDERRGQSSEHFPAEGLELIHRFEQSVMQEAELGHRIRLIGSSGYILDDVKRSLSELRQHYDRHYKRAQNVRIEGLTGTVEALLSNRGVDDPAVAETLKVLIQV